MLGCLAAINVTTAQEQKKKYPYPAVRDMRGVMPPGPKVAPYNSPPLGDGPCIFETYEQRNIRVSVVTKGLSHPWSMAFLPGGDMLITERVGRLRLVRNGVLEPNPVAGIPQVVSHQHDGRADGHRAPSAVRPEQVGLHLVPQAVGMGKSANGEGLPARQQLDPARHVGRQGAHRRHATSSSPTMWTWRCRASPSAQDGMLYMTIGGPGTGPPDSLDRPQHGNDYAGKILRMRDDGSVPPGQSVRRQGRLQAADLLDGPSHPARSGDQSVHGEDLGRRAGPERRRRGEHHPARQELRLAVRQRRPRLSRPLHVAVAVQGRHGAAARRLGAVDRAVQAWCSTPAIASRTGSATCSSAACAKARSPAPASSQRIVFNDNWEELRRESLLRDLHQRIRDVRQGPDGLLYVLTDEDAAALLKIEPVD